MKDQGLISFDQGADKGPGKHQRERHKKGKYEDQKAEEDEEMKSSQEPQEKDKKGRKGHKKDKSRSHSRDRKKGKYDYKKHFDQGNQPPQMQANQPLPVSQGLP